METKTIVDALGALAQDSRLAIYRLLVQAGPQGLAATEIAERLGIPGNTLSFHVKALSHAQLVQVRQDGRYLYYSTNYARMTELIGFLTENCCGGKTCTPAASSPPRRKSGARHA